MSNSDRFRILVVDDEPSVLVTYKLILEKRGYAVQTASTSHDAIKSLKHHVFDMLLCDYSLEQEHTGFEVIAAARKQNPHVAAVLLTGYASKETVDLAEERNITVLFKPIDIDEFFRTVETLRGQNGQSEDSGKQGEGKERKQEDGKGDEGRAASSGPKA